MNVSQREVEIGQINASDVCLAVSKFYEPDGVGVASQAVGGKRALNVPHR